MNKTKLASSSPHLLWYKPYYWWTEEKQLLFTLLLGCSSLWLIYQLSQPQWNNVVVSVLYALIYVVALFGLGNIIYQLIQTKINITLAHHIYHKFNPLVQQIRRKQKDKIDLEQLIHLLPDNRYQPAVLRLTNTIIEEAKDRKFYSNEVLMQPYKEEALGAILTIRVLQKMVLYLGILGTFIGLVQAFSRLTDVGKVEENFTFITQSLQYAFSTSIAGLSLFVLLSIYFILLRKRQAQYFKSMEQATQMTSRLARYSINKDAFLASFDQMEQSLKAVEERVYDQQIAIKMQTQSLQEGVLQLKATKVNFDAFLQDSIQEMKRVYDILSPQKISQALNNHLKQAVTGITHTLDHNLVNQLQKYEQLTTSMQDLNQNLTALSQQVKGQVDLNTNHLHEVTQKVYATIDDLTQLQKNYLQDISTQHINNDLKEGIRALETAFTQKSEELAAILQHLDQSLANYNTLIEQKVVPTSKSKSWWSFK